VRVPRDAPCELAELARRGSLVFVARKAGLLNFLYLGWLLRQLGLPPLRAALGLSGLRAWLFGVRRSQAAFEEALRGGQSSVVFLGGASGPDPFPLLVELQRQLVRPVFLVPALLVWARRPQKLKPTLSDLLLGTPDAPSSLANALGFIVNRKHAVLRLGAASDLSGFVSARPGEPDAILGRKVRGAIHHHLARATRAVVGPPLKTAARQREQVLRDKSLRATLEREAASTGKSRQELEREAERCFKEIASRYSPAFVELVRPVLAWFFRWRFDAVDIDEEGLARVKQAAGDAPIVLCPSHKSHIDYLVLSWVFYENGMTVPHVAAGINLAFWPFGTIARHGGAFFIRRSLRGNKIYTAVLRAYVKQLLRDRFPQEFYVEGGRSRSGKLLFPKTGLVSMEVDAWLEQAADDVLFVPVAIDYQELMEAGAYARELAGGEKRKEDFRGLLRARKALKQRYLPLTIQFEEPVSLRAFAEQRMGPGAASLTLDDAAPAADGPPGAGAQQKKQLVQALANRIAYGINRAVTMTPVGLVATALLSHVRRGISAEEVARRVEFLRYVAAEGGARFSRGLPGAPSDPREPGPIANAVERLAARGLVRVERAAGETIYQVVDERRPQLDYHKNAVIHRYVAAALLAAAVRASGPDAPVDEVKQRVRWLSRLFKLEFMYRVGSTFDELFDENAAHFARLGLMSVEDGRVRIGAERATLEFLADLLRPYLEAYRTVAETLAAADREGQPVDRRSLVKVALERGRADYAAGRVALREALSKVTVENAAEWLQVQGAIASAEGRPRLTASWRDATLPELVREIDRHLAG
jgi:glycerol-3-phosphate O-acyltransferase